MMTERLYNQDAYLTHFEGKVLDCSPEGDGYAVVLDRTAFFPEGGGQKSDVGTLNGIPVTDVQEKSGTVYHTLSAPLNAGETVVGEIDWARRFSAMQNHTGEHILSGILHARFGYNNVGFHLGDDVVTLDVDGKPSEEDLKACETKANEAVVANHPVTVSFPSADELALLDYRSKLEMTENVRIVTIESVDCCACCAPHVSKTGEIGIIKILKAYPNKHGTRIEILCGFRALQDYRLKAEQNSRIMKLLAVPSEQTAGAVERLQDTLSAQSYELKALRDKLSLLSLKPEHINGVCFAQLPSTGFDGLCSCANSLTPDFDGICLLVSDNGDNCIFVLASSKQDIQPMLVEMRTSLHAKGGGKSNYAQGVLPCTVEDVRHFVETVSL